MSPRRIGSVPGARPYSGTQSVRRAIAVLKALGAHRQGLGVTDLAKSVALNQTTVFRLLDALEREGMVARDSANGVFRLGPTMITLGTEALRSMDLYEAAHSELEGLAATTGEATTLEILAGDDVVILDEVHGHHLLGSRPEVGNRWPAYATSTGKVLLAGRPDSAASLEAPLRQLTPKTIRSMVALEKELTAVRRNGYATAIEEVEIGFAAVGAPVRNRNREVIAAIGVGGPLVRFNARRIRELAGAVVAAAGRISRRLGAPNPAG